MKRKKTKNGNTFILIDIDIELNNFIDEKITITRAINNILPIWSQNKIYMTNSYKLVEGLKGTLISSKDQFKIPIIEFENLLGELVYFKIPWYNFKMN